MPNKKMTPMFVGAILLDVWFETIPENQVVTWAQRQPVVCFLTRNIIFGII